MEESAVLQRPMGVSSTSAGIEAAQFDEIVTLHQKRILRLLLSILRDREAAETLTQECFLRAFRNRGSFRHQASVSTWLFRIAVNLARDHQRNRRLAFWKKFTEAEDAGTLADVVVDKRSSPEDRIIARERVEKLWTAVDKLSTRQRDVFVLRYIEEMDLDEIAAITGVETGTAKTHLFRATAAVRKYLRSMES